MKKIILAALLLTSSMTYATKLTCVAKPNTYSQDENVGTLTGADVDITCTNRTNKNDRKRYKVTITTHGPSLYFSGLEGFAIECPFNPDPTGTYYGVDADVGIVLGAGVGVFASRDGLCVLGSAAIFKVGAGIAGGTLVIE